MAEDDVFGGEEGEGEASSSGSQNIFMSAFPVGGVFFLISRRALRIASLILAAGIFSRGRRIGRSRATAS